MATFKATFKETSAGFVAEFGESQEIETGDYEKLANKPKIEGNTLIGDKTFIELGLGEISPQEIDDLFDELEYGRS